MEHTYNDPSKSVIACNSGGVLDGQPCPYYDTGRSLCTLRPMDTCQHQRPIKSDQEIENEIHVPLPETLSNVARSEAMGEVLKELAGHSEMDTLEAALQIVQRASILYHEPHFVESYTNNGHGMSTDMIALSGLYPNVNQIRANWALKESQAKADLAWLEAKKKDARRRMLASILRKGKPTEAHLDEQVKIDDEFREAQQIYLNTKAVHEFLKTQVEAIARHIEVLKKRCEHLQDERRKTIT